jgi:non-specific serine/threonine protein kinase
VGRDAELTAIPTLIHANRLVTLTGVGGVGKTRLAIEVGLQLVKQVPHEIPRDGIWIVELAPLAQPALVAQAIVQLFQIREQPGRTPLELLQEYLAEKHLLLILDNCEHLVDACAELAEQLLLRCWQLRILATSREPLRIPGEYAYPVAPLPLSANNEQRSAHILSSAAAQLFVARMHTSLLPRHATPHEASAIAQICRQLDGIPLALELAAPLTQSMPLAEIASQLQHQMSILTNTYRTAIPRHQTMHSALVWSYRLLAPAEQVLLAHVAVFAGGWTLEAAQAVCLDCPTGRVLPMLLDLITKSLVLEESHGPQRYRLLEPVRQFALTQLQASGMEHTVQRRHGEYFLALAEQMGQARDTPHEREWLQRLKPERDNIRAVNNWAIAQGEAELAQRLNGALFAFWIYCSSMPEANHWYDLVLDMPIAADGRVQTIRALEAKASALNAAGYAASQSTQSYERARNRFERELALRIEIGDVLGIAGALRGCSYIALLSGNLEQAQHLSQQALAKSHSIHDQWGIAWSLYDLGHIALVRGDRSVATELLEAAIPLLRTHGINFGLYRALIALGHALRMAGKYSAARSAYYESLRLQQEMGYIQQVADNLEGLAGIAAAEQTPLQAAILCGAAESHRQVIAMRRWPHEQPQFERDLALAQSQLDRKQWHVAWQQGYAMPLEQAVAYALQRY